LKDNNKYDVCVIGGGLMGSSVALGLVRSGAKVLMVDKINRLHSASRANFGLVWSQSKGVGNRTYSRLSENAVRGFKKFVDWIEKESGIDMELRLGAGLVICVGDQELAARTELINRIHRQAEQYGEKHPSQMFNRNSIQERLGNIVLGENVSGGSFSSIDGDINPLLLLKAMRKIFIEQGGTFVQGCKIDSIEKLNNIYHLGSSSEKIMVPKLVMAAGLGNISLFSMLGKTIPIVPQKGQLLVTERVKPFLPFPFSGIRQTGNGSVMIGYTHEDTGFETATTVSAAVQLAKRAIQIFPCLGNIRVVRSWASLRVLTEDGLPIYDEVDGYSDSYILATHSCVTLASLHMSLLPSWILGGKKPDEIKSFNLERFNVQTLQSTN